MQAGTMNDLLYEQLTEEQMVAELHARDKEIHGLRNRLFVALAQIDINKADEAAAQMAALEEGK